MITTDRYERTREAPKMEPMPHDLMAVDLLGEFCATPSPF